MTTKRINIRWDEAFEEIEREGLSSTQALKLWTKYSNKYSLPTRTSINIGQNYICIKLSRKDVRKLLLNEQPTNYKNCQIATHWSIIVSSYSITLRGNDFQDHSKTKENNWGSLE